MSTNMIKNSGEYKHSFHERGERDRGEVGKSHFQEATHMFQVRLINACIITYNKQLRHTKKIEK